MCSYVFVAGYGNSSKEHWQRIWFEKFENSYWVEQKNWDAPNKDEWVEEIEKTLLHVEGKIVFVAHSIGCQTFVEWVDKYYKNHNIIGALLVAPPDVLKEDFPKEIKGFKNTPLKKLPFKSICVVSSDDIYSSVSKAEFLAKSWGSKMVCIGDKGHINASSNLGEWNKGLELLNSLSSSVKLT